MNKPQLTSMKMKRQRQTIWSNFTFLRLWIGFSISNLTLAVYIISLPIMMLEITKSVLNMGILRMVEFIPNLVFAVYLGVLVDRYSRKSIMLIAVVMQIITLSALVVVTNMQLVNSLVLYIVAFVVSTSGFAVFNAYSSSLPLVVEKDLLVSANASLTFSNSLISIVGPAIAGLLVMEFKYSIGLTVTIIGLVFLLVLILGTHIPSPSYDTAKRESISSDIKEGWRTLVSNKLLWALTLIILLINITSAITGAVLLFYLKEYLKVSTVQYGLIVSSAAVGGVVSSLVVKWTQKVFKRGLLVLICMSVIASGYLFMSFSTNWYQVAVAMCLIGFCINLINIHYFTMRQETTPNHLLGRVSGLSSMVMKLAVPMSYLISGILGELMKANYIFIASGALLFCTIIYGIVRKTQSIN